MADPRITIYNNLSTMLAAGVPIQRALTTVGRRGRFGRLFAQLADAVSRSVSLAEAVDARRQRFEPLDVALIRVGEDTGQLAEAFGMLAQWYDFRQRIGRVIKSGLVLPGLMVHLLAVLAPIPSLALGGWEVGGYVQNVISILALFYIPTALLLAVIFLTPRRGPLRAALDTVVLSVPILGPAVRDLSLSRYCKVFAIGLAAGVPILSAAQLARDAAGNTRIAGTMSKATEAVRRGEPMSGGFDRRLPAEFVAVWEVGEETGDLDESAARLGRIYGEQAENRFQTVAVWTPRLVYAIVAIVMVVHIFRGYSHIYGDLNMNF